MTNTPTSILHTPCGDLQGIYDPVNKVNQFRGIRYATAERFDYPKQVTHWDGVYQADAFGPAAYQGAAFFEPDPEDFYQKEFYQGEHCAYSEDCLFLNIWAPEHADHTPVLVYIHGGGFDHGYSYEPPFDGTAYCKQGVILVTISYRLCALGFLAAPQLLEADGHTGNYALYDQMTALCWIRDNISAFGGDPGNVTLSGQSAGAMSVQFHCVSPLTRGLFHRAIMFSGGGVSNPSRHTMPLEKQLALGETFLKRLQISSPEELRTMDVATLCLEFYKMRSQLPASERFCTPVVDGVFLPESEYALAEKGLQKNIPYMIGTLSEDIIPELLGPMAKDWVERERALDYAPSFLYFFSRQLPGDDKGAWHSADLWYIFNTLDRCWRPFTDWDRQLSHRIVTYISNFAKTGDPGTADNIKWPPYNPQDGTMLFK